MPYDLSNHQHEEFLLGDVIGLESLVVIKDFTREDKTLSFCGVGVFFLDFLLHLAHLREGGCEGRVLFSKIVLGHA